jgi:hypothetical protein
VHARRDNLVEGDFAEEACLPGLRVRAGSSVAALARVQGHVGRREPDGRSDQEQGHQVWVLAQLAGGFSPRL